MYPAYPPTPLRRSCRLGQHTELVTDQPKDLTNIDERILQIAQSKPELMDGFLGGAAATPEVVLGAAVEAKQDPQQQQQKPCMFDDGPQPGRSFAMECVKKDPSLWHMILPLSVDFPRKISNGSMFWPMLRAGHNDARLRHYRYVHVAFGMKGQTPQTLAEAQNGSVFRDANNNVQWESPRGATLTTFCFECLVDIDLQTLTHDHEYATLVLKANQYHGLPLLFLTCSRACGARCRQFTHGWLTCGGLTVQPEVSGENGCTGRP